MKRVCFYVPEDGYVEGVGYRVSMVTEGEPGHRPTGDWPVPAGGVRPYFYGHDLEKARERARRQNARFGLSDDVVAAIVESSIGAQLRAERGAR
ncbi:MAG: hypothetical protein RLO52_34555 [Sandaracinaceae bacterium]